MTDPMLTVEEIGALALSAGCDPDLDDGALMVRIARAVEEATLQAYESQLLRLLADIRFAADDNGKRMQDGLVEHIRELRRDAERWRFLIRNYDEYTVGYIDAKIFRTAIDAAMEEES